MYAKVQLFRDDGVLIVEALIPDGFGPGGWEAPLGVSVVEGNRKLDGFTYIPAPPPRDPEDIAEFRRLYARAFGV